mgnify:CR=1 FL=1
MRWVPIDLKAKEHEGVNFFDSIKTMCGAGSPAMKNGLGIHQYAFTEGMTKNREAMYSADGDMLIVP